MKKWLVWIRFETSERDAEQLYAQLEDFLSERTLDGFNLQMEDMGDVGHDYNQERGNSIAIDDSIEDDYSEESEP